MCLPLYHATDVFLNTAPLLLSKPQYILGACLSAISGEKLSLCNTINMLDWVTSSVWCLVCRPAEPVTCLNIQLLCFWTYPSSCLYLNDTSIFLCHTRNLLLYIITNQLYTVIIRLKTCLKVGPYEISVYLLHFIEITLGIFCKCSIKGLNH
jgi:hypothetical protein